MKPNKRDLRAFVRFDNVGRIIPGSLVLRRVKPQNGHWHEIPAYECCNPPGQVFDERRGAVLVNPGPATDPLPNGGVAISINPITNPNA